MKNVVLFVVSLLSAAAATAGTARKVDPMVGVVGSGNCEPGPVLPHSSIYPSPDSLYPYKGHSQPPSGIHYGDPVVGFSQLHAAGAGGHPSYGLFLVSPRIGEGSAEEENASPLTCLSTKCFAFRGRLDKWGTAVAIAVSRHSALYTFEFPETADARLVFNVSRKIGSPDALLAGSVAFDGEKGAVSGGGTYDRNWNPSSYQAYFYAVLDAVPTGVGTWQGKDSKAGRGSASVAKRGRLGGWCVFDTRKTQTVRMKIAVSFHSVAKAKEWLEKEIPAWDSAALEKDAEAAWDEALSSIRVEGLDAEAETLFYSHLYHTMIQPRDRTGDFAGWPPTQAVWDDHYTLWDTWKSLFPLMAIIRPESVAGNVNAFATRIRHDRECSVAFISGNEFRVGQGGDEADNVICDAWAKKIPGIDWAGAWEVLSANANRRTPEYITLGYMPSDVKHDYDGRLRSGSTTLGFAYNDWCAAQVAEGLGKKAEAAALLARSASWTNVWDAADKDGQSGFTGFVRSKLSNGQWGSPSKDGVRNVAPRDSYNVDFYQGTGWEYSFCVPHDIPGMMERMGGCERFVARLSYALENDLIDFGNEPSFMTVWLFDFAGRPDLASRWANELRKKFPKSGPPGDDDSGAMGSLYVFLTAGFFPIAGQDIYALHGPAVERMEFRVPATGKTFTVIGENAGGDNIYFKSVTLDGKPLDKPFIRHADILAGATLRFVMTNRPGS